MLHTRRGPRAHHRRRGRARGPPRRAGQATASSRTSSSAASATSRPRARSRWPSSRSPTRTAASSASTSPAPSTTTRPSTTARRSSSSATTTSTCTIHAGEAYGPESIAQAIHVCGAHRIGHGCRLREDGDLLHYVNDHRIPLECCPSSNVQTGAVRDLASHPIKLYKNLGLRVTVNTDNRLVTDTTVSKELWLCHTEMGFTFDDLKQIILSRLQERVPAVPREAAVPAPRERRAERVRARAGGGVLAQPGTRGGRHLSADLALGRTAVGGDGSAPGQEQEQLSRTKSPPGLELRSPQLGSRDENRARRFRARSGVSRRPGWLPAHTRRSSCCSHS